MTAPERVVYLDYAATTPVDPAVVQAMGECLGVEGDFGNPASATHPYGTRAAARIERARAQVSALIDAAAEEIVFTSGATESANLAILGAAYANADRGRHIVTSRIEHKAVLDACRQLEKQGYNVTWLIPDGNGVISLESLQRAFRPDTVLVTLMHANNETGVIQDLAGIGALCRERGVLFHSDAAQSVGRIPVTAGRIDPSTMNANDPRRSTIRPANGENSRTGSPNIANVNPISARSAPSPCRKRLQMTS